MRIEWLPEAVRGRDEQLLYIATHNLPAAIEVGDAIEAAVDRLADYPESGRGGRVDGTREVVVNGTPLVVVYQIEEEAVLILRVLHGAQRWPPQER